MPALKIQVGVGLATNPGAAFAPLIASARKARAQVESELAGIGNKAQSVYRQSGRAAEGASDAGTKAAEKHAKAEAKAADAAKKAWQGFFEQQRRGLAEIAAEEGRARSAKFGQMASTAKGMLRAAGGFALDIARGAGVNVDIGAAVGRAVENQQRAVDLSNAAFNTGVPGSEKRVDPTELLKTVRETAKSRGIETAEMMEGLQAFVGKTGDMKSALDLLDNMSKLTKASGANFGDMASMAGEIANGLDGVQDKGQAAFEVMRAFAGQGKMGAVEIKDLASQASKLVAAANAMGGDRAKNLVEMGALAQLSKAFGGASSATQAATSVASLANIFKTPARIREFKAVGVDVYETNAKGMRVQKDFFKIIRDTLVATKGDPEAFKKMFASTVGSKPAEALATKFREAGGGAAGVEAIEKLLKGYMTAGIGQTELDESAKAAENTTKSSVARFNNAMEEIGDKFAAKLGPALEKAVPYVEKFAGALAAMIGTITDNPLEAGLAGLAGVMFGLATGSGAAGAALAGVTIAAMKLIDYITGQTAAGDTEHLSAETREMELESILRGRERRGRFFGKDQETAIKEQAELQSRVTTAGTTTMGDVAMRLASPTGDMLGIGKYLDAALNTIRGEGPDLSKLEQRDKDRQQFATLVGQYTNLTARLNAVLQVNVVNMPATGNPAVDQGNRTGP